MLDQKIILEYAIKGIDAQIDELEKSISKGRKLIKEDESKLYDLQPIINIKKDEIEKLLKHQGELKWQLAELEEK